MTNRLAHETSPYLLQHAHNPVDWYPWGEEALARARSEDKPIFLSIGYAACHWCHVMERESFENVATAQQLNDGFVAIKVDREERPDLDAIYMDAVQQMTGSGGWPMSVFLTPDGKPFYGGTYFPDTARHGMPSFGQVLSGVSKAWHERRDEVEQSGRALAQAVAGELQRPHTGTATIGRALLETAMENLQRSFDSRHGGWGGAPKFPQPMTIELLLRVHVGTGSQPALAMARRTLDAMASGGIHDHLGGGFARYATDAVWLVPHFEKMLYDNAQLARVYLHAWQLTDEPRYRAVAEDTLEFMRRDLLTADGGFAASLDADTDGVEGATYVWSLSEIEALLGPDAAAFSVAYDVTANGNWEGHNILHLPIGSGAEPGLARARQTLLVARARRAQPARDDKVISGWNGLAIAAFAEAGAAFERPDLIALATAAADLLLTHAHDATGRLTRSWKDGSARQLAVLEDHADLADGLLALYEATFGERWFRAARALADTILARFSDPAGGFFDTADDHEELFARPRSVQDNAVPSGGAMAADILVRLAALTGEGGYQSAAERAVSPIITLGARHPSAFAHWLNAAAFMVFDQIELAVSGDPSRPDARALLAVAGGAYRPFAVVAAGESDLSQVPLLNGRPQRDGVATAYVCRRMACREPVTDPAALVAQLVPDRS